MHIAMYVVSQLWSTNNHATFPMSFIARFMSLFLVPRCCLKSTNSHLLCEEPCSGDYIRCHATTVCTSKMESLTKPYFRTSLEHFMRLLQSYEKVMGGCTAQCKILLFDVKTREKVTQFWTSPSEEENNKKKEKHFGHSVTFWFGTFTTYFRTTGSLVGHEYTQRWMVCCHKVTVLEILRYSFVLPYTIDSG